MCAYAADMFAHGMPTTRVIVSISCSRQDAPFTALELLYSIALERFGVAGSWPATPRRRSVLLLFGFNFTGFGERAILTTHQGPSPDAVRSPAHLCLLPCLPCPAFAHYRPILTACHRCNSIEAGGAESAQVVCRGSSSSSSSSSAELAACEGGEALRTRCATRPSHTPV